MYDIKKLIDFSYSEIKCSTICDGDYKWLIEIRLKDGKSVAKCLNRLME